MEFSQIVAPFTRPAAIIAALAGILVLSIAFSAARRAHRRRVARKEAEKRCRQLVGQMRRCPKLRRPEDRRLVEKFAAELDAIVRANGFALHEVGTSRMELDRILHLVREEEQENPFMKRVAPPPSERPARAEGSGVRAIALPAEFPKQEATVLFEATFTEADFPPPDGEPLETADGVIVVIEEPDRTEAPAGPSWSDPIRALRETDEGEIDAYVDERFAAIVNKE